MMSVSFLSLVAAVSCLFRFVLFFFLRERRLGGQVVTASVIPTISGGISFALELERLNLVLLVVPCHRNQV